MNLEQCVVLLFLLVFHFQFLSNFLSCSCISAHLATFINSFKFSGPVQRAVQDTEYLAEENIYKTKNLKLKDVENEMYILKRNYSYYVKLTEELQTRINELKQNMNKNGKRTSLLENKVDQLVQEKLSQLKRSTEEPEEIAGAKHLRDTCTIFLIQHHSVISVQSDICPFIAVYVIGLPM